MPRAFPQSLPIFSSQAATARQKDLVEYRHVRPFYEIIARVTDAFLSALIERET